MKNLEAYRFMKVIMAFQVGKECNVTSFLIFVSYYQSHLKVSDIKIV